MPAPDFLDTNILAYAYDMRASGKAADRAGALRKAVRGESDAFIAA
jgi:predicted nucleic acid-binding protein